MHWWGDVENGKNSYNIHRIHKLRTNIIMASGTIAIVKFNCIGLRAKPWKRIYNFRHQQIIKCQLGNTTLFRCAIALPILNLSSEIALWRLSAKTNKFPLIPFLNVFDLVVGVFSLNYSWNNIPTIACFLMRTVWCLFCVIEFYNTSEMFPMKHKFN